MINDFQSSGKVFLSVVPFVDVGWLGGDIVVVFIDFDVVDFGIVVLSPDEVLSVPFVDVGLIIVVFSDCGITGRVAVLLLPWQRFVPRFSCR